MPKDAIVPIYASNELENTDQKHTDNQNNPAQGENNHSESSSHGGNIPPSEVFPTLLKSLGEHRELTFFHYHIADLPVIIYDNKEGFNVYSSVNTMSQAGKFTIDHKSHKLVRASDHQAPTLDLSVTSLVVFQWLAMLVMIVLFFKAGSRYKKAPKKEPKGLQNMMETMVVFLRDDVIGPNIGGAHITNRLLPYFVVLFFFILIMNFIGLLPGGHTSTGALGTTAALALCSLLVINLTQIKEVGIGAYLKHLTGGAPLWLAPIMIPIEILSIFTKPFALTVRLFANMTAGHVVLLSLVGLIFYFKSLAVAPVSVGFSIFMYALEILVALLQAYIFTILTAVFTGLGVGHHDEGHSEHSHA
jgi:F-type H+-transporting ATPase subunit a